MTEKEIIQKIYEVIKLVDCMQYNPLVDFNYLRAKCAYNIIKNQVEHIEAENAALREQISKMIMPPCTLGDTLHVISFYFGDGYDETGKTVHKIGWQITETKVDEKNLYRMCDLVRNKKAFFSREAAEARLAELKGGAK